MHCEIEEWIENALTSLRLSHRSIDSVTSRRVLSATQSRFVSASPRVWWLGFSAVISRHPAETCKLSALVPEPDVLGWFIPETEGRGSRVYRLTAKEAESVIADCPFFEYYFLDAGEKRLIAETDHNQFVVAAPLPDLPPTTSRG